VNHWGLADALTQRRQQSLYRRRLTLESAQGPVVTVGGESLLAFCSNDYLGLANHPDVIAACKSGLEKFGAGAGASHLISGHLAPHEALENALARFTGRERALLFTSGYQANIGIVNALLGEQDQVFQDYLNHASLLDGGFLSRASHCRYAHSDPHALSQVLENADGQRLLVATDGVFSMDGDIAPLPELAAVCERFNACLLVDDAHGFGVIGKTGAGSLELLGLSPSQVPLLMGTLGKALGLMGAFVAGSEDLIETLIQNARSYIYTTALPPAIASAALVSLGLARAPDLREKLRANIRQFQQGAQQLGLVLLPSDTAVQPLILGDSETALAWSEALRSQGMLVPAIRPPTVPAGSARLRIAISAAHDENHIKQLLDALNQTRGRLPS
jgi:8-amino-7-oxononanoate synthase